MGALTLYWVTVVVAHLGCGDLKLGCSTLLLSSRLLPAVAAYWAVRQVIGGAFVCLLLQRFRVRHGLSCVIGPMWLVGAGCYSQAALPMPLSKPL